MMMMMLVMMMMVMMVIGVDQMVMMGVKERR